MRTLALDTSTNQGGIAVLKDRVVLSRRVWTREKSHSEMLTATLESCLEEAGLKVRDLNRIAVGKGPGSFTGIRIAINAARALAYTLSIPVFAFDTTEILAAAATPSKTPVLALVNAHKNLLYTSRFEEKSGTWQRTLGPVAMSLADIENLVSSTEHLCIGDGFAEIETVLSSGLKAKLKRDPRLSDYPMPEVLGTMVESWSTQPLVWNELQALYIRASEAEEKLRETLANRSGE